MLSQEKEFKNKREKKTNQPNTHQHSEISYVTSSKSPIKLIAGKIICQWSRCNLCHRPARGLRTRPPDTSECDASQAGATSEHTLPAEGTGELTASCPSPGGTCCLQPLERQHQNTQGLSELCCCTAGPRF